MKKNAKQLLLSLYTPESTDNGYGRSYQYLTLVFSHLSAGGLRSLMRRLFEGGWVHKMTKNNRTYFSLTQAGRLIVLELFPSLRPARRKSGSQQLLVCLTPPVQDPHFSQLRTLLAQQQAIRLTRGVYVLHTTQSFELRKALLGVYNTAVVVCSVERWVFGELSRVETTITANHEVQQRLSGVSNQLQRLTGSIRGQKRLSKHHKRSFSSCFIELAESIAESAVPAQYDAEVAGLVHSVWAQWTHLCTLITPGDD